MKRRREAKAIRGKRENGNIRRDISAFDMSSALIEQYKGSASFSYWVATLKSTLTDPLNLGTEEIIVKGTLLPSSNSNMHARRIRGDLSPIGDRVTSRSVAGTRNC